MRRSALFLLLAGSLAAPTAAADDYPRDWNVDVTHYAFHLTVTDSSDEVVGAAEITVRFAAGGVREVALDLIGTSTASSTGMTVESVTRDGAPVAHRHADDRLRISLATPSIAEERRTFRVAYRGVPADGLIIDENMFGDRTFFGDNYPERARHWLPTVDHVSDKATVEWVIVAPDHYQVVATGRLVERSDLGDDTRRTHWRSTVAVPPKVMVIGVARFAVQNVAVVDGVPVQSWVYPQNRDAGFHDYALAERILRFFVGRIGPYPYAKLANVQSKTRYGGMENASNIFYSERSVRGDRGSEGLIAHEVAHQWWGDSVTEGDWHHNWLSEGFATYFAQLYLEFQYGRERREEGMRSARDTVRRFRAANPGLALIAENVSDPNDLLNRNAYQKGAWLLHMLRRQVGDENFWRAIRRYYEEFRDRTALTEDLQRVVQETSGQQLEWFFHQWANVPGHPVLAVEWRHDGGQLMVTIRQTQADAVFRFPLDIQIIAADGSRRTEKVDVSQPEQRVTFEAPRRPAELVLDPGVWLLYEGGIAADRP